MRSVYAAHLTFAPGTVADEVIVTASEWPCRGAVRDHCPDWMPGTTTFEIETNFFGRPVNNQFTVEGIESPEGRLWDLTWTQPHADDPGLLLVTNVTVAEKAEKVRASLVMGTTWLRPQVSMPRFSMRAPRLATTLLNRYEVYDSKHRLHDRPIRLDGARAEEFVEDLLLDPDRSRPVVFVSDDPVTMQPLVDPKELAEQLAGMAHVYYSTHGYPDKRVADTLGYPLGARNGAMRIWWPHLTRQSDPYQHRLYSGSALRDWRGPVSPVDMLFRAVSIASATNAAPPEYALLRQSARRAARATATDMDTYKEFLDEAEAENKSLHDRLEDAEHRVAFAVLERDEAREELEQARETKRLADKQYALGYARQQTTAAPSEDVEDELPAAAPQSVIEAVRQAELQCSRLVFADRAYETAADCPYEYPADILEDLLLLDRLARLWARPEGIGGMDMAAKARELGLTWKPGISTTTTGGTKARHYDFNWNGQKLRVGPHTRRDRGNGAGRIARIYLYKHEPDDPTERRLVVGVVGRKLEDSTTG